MKLLKKSTFHFRELELPTDSVLESTHNYSITEKQQSPRSKTEHLMPPISNEHKYEKSPYNRNYLGLSIPTDEIEEQRSLP